MNKRIMRKEKGITLIALIITIVILIILAGVSINLVLGEDGIINKAKYAKDKYTNSAISEQEQLNELYLQLGDKDLPQNSEDTQIGTIVKLPDGWGTETMRYVSTEDGLEIKNTTKVATVYAVAVGGGKSVPVPYGFYYVGGTLDTGVIISDKKEDEYKSGIDKTAHSYSTQLQGNQFVFIPCSIEEYTKKNDWGYTNASGWDLSTNSAEKTQIQKYGGFYVGRYEAGMGEVTLNNGNSITQAITTTNWQNDCYTIKNVSATSKPTTKAGEIPYFHSDYNTALTMSERMYNTNYVGSGLITGTQWDVMLKWMSSDKTNYSDLKENSNWGNYNNTTLKDCSGRYCTVTSNGSSSEWTDNTLKTNKYNEYYTILTTGASETSKKKNLYDVAGNLWEWTQETAYKNSETNYFMLRGGSCYNAYASFPVCYRICYPTSNTNTPFGFRVVLYMK